MARLVPIQDEAQEKPRDKGIEKARAELRKKLVPIEPVDPLEQLKAFTGAAAGSGLESTGMLGGGMAGAKLGGMAGNPWITAAGAIGGGIAGMLGSGQLRDFIAERTGYLQRPAQLPPESRSSAYAGEVVGGGLPFVAAPYLAARMGVQPAIKMLPQGLTTQARTEGVKAAAKSIPTRVGYAISNIPGRAIEGATRQPIANLRRELGALTGAAIGASSAEEMDPGNATLRTGMEIVGGLAPAATELVASKTRDVVGRVKSAFSKEAQKNRAGQQIRSGIQALGGDPEDVLARLQQETREIPPALAESVDDPYILGKTAQSARNDPTFRRKFTEKSASLLGDLDERIAREASGTDKLRASATKRYEIFRNSLDDRLSAAREASSKAAGNITTDEPRVRSALGRRSSEIMDETLSEARDVEAKFWGRVNKDISGAIMPSDSADGLVGTMARMRSRRLDRADPMPDIITENVGLYAEAGETSVGKLNTFRSRMLEMARRTTDPNQEKDRATFLAMADAAKNEISHIVQNNGDDSAKTALDDAREFSRALHDTFTRSYAGDTIKTRTTGEEAIMPETVLRRAFSSGNEVGETQFREMREATEFLPARGFGDPQKVTEMRNLQDRYLRLTAAEMTDPVTGEIKPSRISAWMKKNQGTLDDFPEMRRDLQNAMKAQNREAALARHYRKWTTPQARKSAYAELVGNENPAAVVRAAESSKMPTQELENLARLAKRNGPAAREGLSASVFENIIEQSRDASGGMAFDKLQRNLRESRALRVMQSSGVISDTQIANANRIAQEGARIQGILSRKESMEALDITHVSEMEDLLTRLAATHVATVVSPSGPGALTAAGASVRAARRSLQLSPSKKLESMIEQAMLDKDFAIDLMKRSKTPKQRELLRNKTRAYLAQIGVGSETEDDEAPVQAR